MEWTIKTRDGETEIEKKALGALRIALDALGATDAEGEAVLNGAYQAADPEDVLRDPRRYAEDEINLLREEE